MARLRSGCGQQVQRCENLRKLLPRSDLPGAQQKTPCHLNRYVLLLIYILGVGCTGPVFFNWPPLAELLFWNGAFIDLCKKDPVSGAYTPDLRVRKPRQQLTSSGGAAGSSSTDRKKTQENRDEDQKEGGKPYVCDAQETAVQQLYTLCCAVCCCFCGVAGALVDICGPRLTSVAGRLLQLVGWLLLAFADTDNALYYVGLVFVAAGIEAAVLPTISVCRLFPASEGFIITIVGSALSVSYAVPLVMKHFVEAYGVSFRTVVLCYALACPLTFTIVAFFFMPVKSFQHFPAETLEERPHDWEKGDRGDKHATAALRPPTERGKTDEQEGGRDGNHSGESRRRVTSDDKTRERNEEEGEGSETLQQRRGGEDKAEPEGEAPEFKTEQRRDVRRRNDEEEEGKRKELLLKDAEQKSTERDFWCGGGSGSTKRDIRSGSTSVGPRYNNDTQETVVECAELEDSGRLTNHLKHKNNSRRRRYNSGDSIRQESSSWRSPTSSHSETRLPAENCGSSSNCGHNRSSLSTVKTTAYQSVMKMSACEAEHSSTAAAPAAVGNTRRSSVHMQHCSAYNDINSCRSSGELRIPAENETQCAAAVATPAANASCVSKPRCLSHRAVLASARVRSVDAAVHAAAHAVTACRSPSNIPHTVREATVDHFAADHSPPAFSPLPSPEAAEGGAATDREAATAAAADVAGPTAGCCVDAPRTRAVEISATQRFRCEELFAAAPVVDEHTRTLCRNHVWSRRMQEAGQLQSENESIPGTPASSSAGHTVESSGVAGTSGTLPAVSHVADNTAAAINNRKSSVAMQTTGDAAERENQEQSTEKNLDGWPSSCRNENREGISSARIADAVAESEEARTFLGGVTRCQPPFEETTFSTGAGDPSLKSIPATAAAPRSAEAVDSAATGSQAVCCHVLECERDTNEHETTRLWHSRDLPLLHHPKAKPCIDGISVRTTAEERESTGEGGYAAPSRSERVTEAGDAKQKDAARKCMPDNSGNKDAADGCDRACYHKICCCCCCPLVCAQGSRRCAKWLRQLNNDSFRSAMHQLISERYILIFVYKLVVVLVATYFQQAGHRMFCERVLYVRGMLLPFSFVPCIILGQAADYFGIVRVLFVVNFFGLLTYFFSFFTAYSAVWAYLSVCCFVCYMSFYSSQVFIYIEETFMPEHFGKLSGFSLMAGGITSLVAHPLYSYFTVTKNEGNTMPVRIALTVLLLLLNLLLVRLLILYKKDPQPYQTSRVLSEHSDDDQSRKGKELDPTVEVHA